MDRIMVKRVLMIAFHYPPMRGSSGIQRTLKFAQYLPLSGWEPVILSANARAYQYTSADQLCDTRMQLPVTRCFALDTSRHLSLRGRYAAVLALPDRWASWWLGAIPAGLRLIRRYRPDVIWSTYPIASAHLIGLTLQRLSGIPWIVDQRDPMTDTDYPPDPRMRRAHHWIERKINQHGAGIVYTTPGAIATHRQRFPELEAKRLHLIENAFDDDDFSDAEANLSTHRQEHACFRLLHSGIVYPSERDPTALFGALSQLLQRGELNRTNFKLVLRASANEAQLGALIVRYGVAELVELLPPLPYSAALAEMLEADGLLLLQAANCNAQIPAKLYEYLRAARPILALTDPSGDSAAKLRSVGIDTIAALDSESDIIISLRHFLSLARRGQAPLAGPDAISLNSRAARTIELARLLDQIAR
jgi:hypothetical protein